MRSFKEIFNRTPENLPSVYSLSPKTDLNNDNTPGYDVYKKYLIKAFNKTCIHNIVVSGDFGIGKSSVIRSFEKDYCKNKKCSFLYVSLGDFKKTESSFAKEEKNKYRKYKNENINKNSNQQSILERRLLLQIYSSFHRKDLPASSFKMVQEHSFYSKFLVPFFCAFTSLIVFLLFFFEPISDLLTETLTQFYSMRFEKSNLNIEEQTKLLNDTISLIYHYESKIHLLLYFVIMIIILVSMYLVVQYVILKWHTKSLTIKADTFEATCEKEACDSYLDQHKTEIVYCLEKIAPKINYTLVFEDLDRLSTTDCLEILTRLHEINYLVNLRLSKKHKQKRIRFVYVVNDGIINNINHSKFADYILAIFPRVNEKTAERILLDNIIKINDELNSELDINLTPSNKNPTHDNLISLVATYLSDYRLQFTILNEYSLLFRLYYKSNTNTAKESITKTAENILAFVIYKNLFPNDYSKILVGTSNVFPIYHANKFKNNKKRELLDNLICGSNPILTPSCLYYAGYSKENIVNMYIEKLNTNFEETLNLADKELNTELHEALCAYCCNIGEIFSTCLTEGTYNIINPVSQKVHAIIKYMVKHKINNFNWLLNKSIPAINILEILSFEDFDDSMIKEFFELVGLDTESEVSVFDRCKEKKVNNNVISGTDSICNERDLNEREYVILKLGIGKKYSSANSVRVNGTYKPLNRDL